MADSWHRPLLLGQKEYLLIVDYYSKFPVIRKVLGHSTSTTIIDLIKQVFSEQGILNKAISDNRPQYSSTEFAKFAEMWDFEHVTFSPHYPQSGLDPHMALLCNHTIPVDSSLHHQANC